MAFKLDNDLLEELGLAALSADEKQAMLRQILETLEMRVGTTLASKMTDAQLDEFEQLMPTESDAPEAVQQKEQQALQWLESNFPDYKQVVNDELEKLKVEIRESAPHIVAAAQQQAMAATSANPSTYSPPTSIDQGSTQPQPSYSPQPSEGPSVSSAPPVPMPVPPQQPLQDLSTPPQPAPGFVPPIPSQQPSPFQPMPPTDDPGQGSSYPPQAS